MSHTLATHFLQMVSLTESRGIFYSEAVEFSSGKDHVDEEEHTDKQISMTVWQRLVEMDAEKSHIWQHLSGTTQT